MYEDRLMRTFLVDGFVAGSWQVSEGRLSLAPFAPLARPDREAVAEEAQRVAAFLGVTPPSPLQPRHAS
jgi:hypothetical protein